MRNVLSRVVLIAVVGLAGACKERPVDTSSTQTTSAGQEQQTTSATQEPRPDAQASGTSTSTPEPLASGDKDFMIKAAQGGMLEVALGQEAARKATSPDARSFGEHMTTDHGRANEELRHLADQKGVTLPSQLDDEHKKDFVMLSKLKGARFDKEYESDMVQDHENDVKEFRKATQELKDLDLRAWAEKTLPILEGHLAMARQLQGKQQRTK